MIRTNLSTRPFYNERAVQLWLLMLAAIVGCGDGLQRRPRHQLFAERHGAGHPGVARRVARRGSARRGRPAAREAWILRQIELASTEARQANELIDRRTFSWTELFNQFETTFPADVRITAVRPTIDESGAMQLTINVVARSVEDVDELIGNLEGTGSFSNLLSVQERFNSTGLLVAVVEGTYLRARTAPRRGHAGGETAMTLLQRVLREKRSIIVPLFIALLANVAAYALVVRPLGVRSATAADRAQAARASLAAAEGDLEAARALVAGKTLAEQELSTFYDKVLPADMSAARRMTYASLPALARRANVKYDASRSDDRTGEGATPRAPPHQHGARGRLRRRPAIHLRARDDACVRDHRRRDAGAERPGRAARAVARALGVLPDGVEWRLSAAAR